MTHPFERIFEKAITNSTSEENHVLREARKLIDKGYSRTEICTLLARLEKGRIDADEACVFREAYDELCEEGDIV